MGVSIISVALPRECILKLFDIRWEIVEVLAVEAPREVEEEAEDDLKSLHPMHHELILQFKYLWKIYLQLPKYPKSKNTFQAWDRSK